MLLKGSVNSIIFRNDDNGYSVVDLKTSSGNIVCVGTFPPLAQGQELQLEGDYVLHSKFGTQFKAASVKATKPSSLGAIMQFLSSGLIKGIGEVTAQKIVDRFGLSSLEILELQPLRLSEIRGISPKKAEEFGEAYLQIKSMQDAIMFLQEYGVGIKTAIKIHKIYGAKTIAVVAANPYKLVEDVKGIGFLTADKIAREVGFDFNSPLRKRAGIIHVLRESADRTGNTYLPMSVLAKNTLTLLGLDSSEAIEDALRSLAIDLKIKMIEFDGESSAMLMPYYKTEKNIAKRINKLLDESNRAITDYASVLGEFERSEDVLLHDKQIRAISMAVQNGISVITGGPGTGKTTIIKAILQVFNSRNLKTVLLAPTGRAAKRISESCGADASTIHRALPFLRKSDPEDVDGDSRFTLEADAVIVDEVSMVDVFLFNALLGALAFGTRLILVGDKDQLPSVGAGNVLSDILSCRRIPSVNLEYIYRQGHESLITKNAHLINSGQMPVLDSTDKDFFFIASESQQNAAEKILELIVHRLPRFLGVEPKKITVLAPLKNGAAGVINLNKLLQDAINPALAGKELRCGDFVFRTGDKVMHIKNNYDLGWVKRDGVYEEGEGVFNGDMGTITQIRKATNEIDVLFDDGRHVCYDSEDRKQLVLAYAVTVHKSQGSEFDAVIIPVVSMGPQLMTRNLLYTAVTRAKRLAVLVGEKRCVAMMVKNNYVADRFCALRHFLAIDA